MGCSQEFDSRGRGRFSLLALKEWGARPGPSEEAKRARNQNPQKSGVRGLGLTFGDKRPTFGSGARRERRFMDRLLPAWSTRAHSRR